MVNLLDETPGRRDHRFLLVAAIAAAIIIGLVVWAVVRDSGSKPTSAAVPTATSTAVNSAVVEGNVWVADYPHGPAIPNAWVNLIGRFDGNQYKRDTAQTDSEGHFKFSGVPYGTYDLAVNADGYAVTMTAESFEVQQPDVVHDLLPWKQGTTHPLGPVGDTINFVRAGGVHNRDDAVIVILGFSFAKSEDEIASVDCNIVVTHNDVRIAYRAGGSIEFYSGGLIDEAACKVVLKNGDVWYVQRVCGNLLKVPPGAPPIVVKQVTPTATPTQGKEVPSTPTNTPVPGSSPSPSATSVPPTATPKATQTAAPTEGPCNCTPTVPDRPTVIPTPANTEVVPTNTVRPTNTTSPDPVKTATPPVIH